MSPGKITVSGIVIICSTEKLLSVDDADVLKTVLLHLITNCLVLGYRVPGGIWVCISSLGCLYRK